MILSIKNVFIELFVGCSTLAHSTNILEQQKLILSVKKFFFFFIKLFWSVFPVGMWQKYFRLAQENYMWISFNPYSWSDF